MQECYRVVAIKPENYFPNFAKPEKILQSLNWGEGCVFVCVFFWGEERGCSELKRREERPMPFAVHCTEISNVTKTLNTNLSNQNQPFVNFPKPELD